MARTTLYHASTHVLKPDMVIPANTSGTYYPKVVEALEVGRPTHMPSRKVCVFAADSVEAATAFITSQTDKPFNVYAVDTVDFCSAPFCISHEISRRLEANRTVAALVEEYWKPKYSWTFLEYFGSSFRVIEVMPSVSIPKMISFKIGYEERDMPQARKL